MPQVSKMDREERNSELPLLPQRHLAPRMLCRNQIPIMTCPHLRRPRSHPLACTSSLAWACSASRSTNSVRFMAASSPSSPSSRFVCPLHQFLFPHAHPSLSISLAIPLTPSSLSLSCAARLSRSWTAHNRLTMPLSVFRSPGCMGGQPFDIQRAYANIMAAPVQRKVMMGFSLAYLLGFSPW